jgi:putative hydrolase of the HAD superfamily
MIADRTQMGADNHGIRAIFFDFGGVILKTFDGVDHDAIEAEFGLEAKMLRKCVYRDSRYMDFQVGKCTYGEWADSIREALLKIDERADAIMNAFIESPRVFNHEMLGLVKRLHGRYTLGIISNTTPGMEERLRERFDLTDLFDVRVGSGDLGIAKPDAGIFRHAMKLAGLAPEQSVFTDDRARVVGMRGFHFTDYERFVGDLRSVGVEA